MVVLRRGPRWLGPEVGWWGVAMAIGIVCVIAVSWFVWPAYRTADVRDAPARHAMATVLSITPVPVTRARPDPRCFVVLSVDGRRVQVRLYDPPPVGKQVRVDYRVGKSGRIFIGKVVD